MNKCFKRSEGVAAWLKELCAYKNYQCPLAVMGSIAQGSAAGKSLQMGLLGTFLFYLNISGIVRGQSMHILKNEERSS